MSLIAKINEEIKLLNEEQFPQENEYKYYESLAEVINAEKGFVGFSDIDIMLTLFIINRKEKTFNETLTAFKSILNYCTTLTKTEKFMLLLDVIENLSDYVELEQMINFTENFNAKEVVVSACVEEDISFLEEVDLKLKITALLFKYKQIGLEIFENSKILKLFVEMYYTYDGILNEDYASLSYVEERYGTVKLLKKFSEKHFDISKKRESYITNKNKKVKLYRQTIEILEQMNLKPNKIVELPESIYTKLDDEICFELLKVVLEHNRKIFNELELKNIKSDRYNKIEKLFIQYGFPINELKEEDKNILLKNSSPAELEKLLHFLTKDKWLWLNVKHPNFVEILLNSSVEILEFVNHYLEEDMISQEFIEENIGILLDEVKNNVNEFDVEPLFNIFKTNIEYLNRVVVKLDRRILKNNRLLIMPTKLLKETISLAKKYQLNFKSENAKQYSLEILNHEEIFDYLDSFIELGYANYIKENCQTLKVNGNDIVPRLSIMTNIGLNPMSKEDRLLGSITNGKNFYVGTSSLKQYSLLKVEEYIKNPYFEILKGSERLTVSKKTESLDIVKTLDDMFKTSELEYVINDTVISRIKFLRNLECLLNYKVLDNDMIFASLAFNSVLDESTIVSIKNIFSNQTSEIDKKKSYTLV